ncbi:MAG: uridine kinase [Anaerolineae bacterium]|nr:MAG: uridine kinase [Anaerolineae bacterium]
MEHASTEYNVSQVQILSDLAKRINTINLDHPIRVAIDGIDAAGKSTLAGELQSAFTVYDRPVIRASIDGFHNPKALRYSQGRNSPQGYFEDSFNYHALREYLLQPLGPEGNRSYCTSCFDYRADRKVVFKPSRASDKSILLFDGIFLLRPELADQWDYSIFVDVSFELSLARALRRDSGSAESVKSVEQLYRERYFPGQRLYLDSCHPELKANVLVRNESIDYPVLEVIRE